MKYYITKYALTDGIVASEARKVDEDGYMWTANDTYGFSQMFKIGRDAFITVDEAFKKAEAMRKKRIASLKKSLAEVEQMTFVVKS